MVIPITFQFYEGTQSCTNDEFDTKYKLFILLPSISLCVLTISTYVVVLIRIVKQMKNMANTSVHSTTENKKRRGKLVTLGLIIASMVMTYLPRITIGIITLFSDPDDTMLIIRRMVQI